MSVYDRATIVEQIERVNKKVYGTNEVSRGDALGYLEAINYTRQTRLGNREPWLVPLCMSKYPLSKIYIS